MPEDLSPKVTPPRPVVVGKVTDHKSAFFGCDAQTGEYGDLIRKGIIDPAKVVRVALQDASSVAG